MEMAKTGATTAVAAWMAGGQVKVGKLSLTTGKVSSAKSIGKTDDHITTSPCSRTATSPS